MRTDYQHPTLFKHDLTTHAINWLLHTDEQRKFEEWQGFACNNFEYYITLSDPRFQGMLAIVVDSSPEFTDDESVTIAIYNLLEHTVSVVNEQTTQGETVVTTRDSDFTDDDRPWQTFSCKRLSDNLIMLTLHYVSDDSTFKHNQHWVINHA